MGVVIVGLIFSGAGILLLWAAQGWRGRVKDTLRWPAVPGRITNAELCADTSGDGVSYFPHVTYSYEVDGKIFENDAIAIGGSTGTFRGRAQRWLDRHPKGSLVTVHYDPSDPTSAVLQRRSTNARLATLIGLVALVAGVAMIGFALRLI
jgi:hypothetical protein